MGMRVMIRNNEEREGGKRNGRDGRRMSLLEDLSQHPVSLDAVYVLSDDGVLFVSSLFLQPLHHRLVVVPQVRLQGGRGQSGTISQIRDYQYANSDFIHVGMSLCKCTKKEVVQLVKLCNRSLSVMMQYDVMGGKSA